MNAIMPYHLHSRQRTVELPEGAIVLSVAARMPAPDPDDHRCITLFALVDTKAPEHKVQCFVIPSQEPAPQDIINTHHHLAGAVYDPASTETFHVFIATPRHGRVLL